MDMITGGDGNEFSAYFISYLHLLKHASRHTPVDYTDALNDFSAIDNNYSRALIPRFLQNRAKAQDILQRDASFENAYKCSITNPPRVLQ